MQWVTDRYMGKVFLLLAIYMLFCVCIWIYKKINLFRIDRRRMRNLKYLEEQVATINLEHMEHELMGFQKQAQELFAHIDSTTGKKNTAWDTSYANSRTNKHYRKAI